MALAGPPRARGADGAAGHGQHDLEAMKAQAREYWRTHKPVGASPKGVQGEPAATFTVNNFFFNNGGPAQVDTARILVGESVRWQWVAGFHTITSGTGTQDPNAGALFDQSSDMTNDEFIFTYNAAGTFPFFCAFHELQNMRGIVEVSTPTDVSPHPDGTALGFARDPAPNPTRSGVTFHYALRLPGRARAEVFDANGRRIVVLVDRDLPAGTFTGTWNGLTPAGLADTGVYYIRLRLPGYDESRRVVIRR
jgi:hypothetical protein